MTDHTEAPTALCPGYPECDHETWGNAGDVFSHGVEHGQGLSAAALRASIEERERIEALVRLHKGGTLYASELEAALGDTTPDDRGSVE